jgi:anti-anti-sigma regulatory factor
MLDYEKQEKGDVTIFSLKGNLDALTAPSLKKEIEALMAARKINVVLISRASS